MHVAPLIGDLNGWYRLWSTKLHKDSLDFLLLLFRESATCTESIGVMERELYTFIPCHRGFSFGFAARGIFLLLFFRLVKANSIDQLLGMQRTAALRRAGVLQVHQICTGTTSHKEGFTIKMCRTDTYCFGVHNMEQPSKWQLGAWWNASAPQSHLVLNLRKS